MDKNKIRVSIIIVNYKTKELTKQCIDSVIKNTKSITFEIIVVDNASNDESTLLLENMYKKGIIKLIKSKQNLGFAGGNNLGIKVSSGSYVLLLNSDTIIKGNVIKEMVEWLGLGENKQVGIASCALKGKDGEHQFPGGSFPTLLRVFSWMTIEDLPLVTRLIKPFHPRDIASNYPSELDWVTGTFFLIKRQVVDQVGQLDDDYFMYTEEVDYCYRVRAKGWKIMYQPQWSIVHLGSASSSNEFAILQEFKGIKIFYKKHYASWQYKIVILLLKLGSLVRVVAFTLLARNQISKIYVKAFRVI